jgi:hypothetical protein
MSQRRAILFLTNSEYGQSNVMLAVTQEFLLHDDFSVPVGSFGELGPRLERVNKDVAQFMAERHSWNARPIAAESEKLSQDVESSTRTPQAVFHSIQGPSLTDILTRDKIDLSHRPGMSGAILGFHKANLLILGCKPAEYIRAYKNCLDIFPRVVPAVVVVDPIFHIAIDACRSAGLRTVVLWPTPLKDAVITIQPFGGLLWKYPL